jgi:hypothetical protein
MVAASAASPSTELRSFRLATPAVEPTNRVQATAAAALSVLALTIWLVVLPAEVVLRLTV